MNNIGTQLFLLTLQSHIAEKLNEMLVFCMNAHDFGHAEANEVLRLFWRVFLHMFFYPSVIKKQWVTGNSLGNVANVQGTTEEIQ